MKFSKFIDILAAHGFSLHRHGATSHRLYRGEVNGEVKFVTVAVHRMSDEIKPKTLSAMIRQSGLDKKLFR